MLVSVHTEIASDTISQAEEHVNREYPPTRGLGISISAWSSE
jgi:hypothetical protein